VVDDIRTHVVWRETKVKFPEPMGWGVPNKMLNDQPYYVMGLTIRNEETGERCSIRNDSYEYVRKLRGNQPKLKYRYLELRKEKQIREFLKYFPEHTSIFDDFFKKIYTFTNKLYSNYISCYIKKEKTLKDFEWTYRTSMFKLHQLYKEELMPQHKYITKQVTVAYVNSLHEKIMMGFYKFTLYYNNGRTNNNFIK